MFFRKRFRFKIRKSFFLNEGTKFKTKVQKKETKLMQTHEYKRKRNIPHQKKRNHVFVCQIVKIKVKTISEDNTENMRKHF